MSLVLFLFFLLNHSNFDIFSKMRCLSTPGTSTLFSVVGWLYYQILDVLTLTRVELPCTGGFYQKSSIIRMKMYLTKTEECQT
jgi:hypothetical protein